MRFDYRDFEWIGDDPRDAPSDTQTPESGGRLWEEVRPDFLALIDKTFGEFSPPTLP
jgi:hypothetical protein